MGSNSFVTVLELKGIASLHKSSFVILRLQRTVRLGYFSTLVFDCVIF